MGDSVLGVPVANMGARSNRTDTEHESQAVRQNGRAAGDFGRQKAGAGLTKLDGLAKDMVIEQAITDKLALAHSEAMGQELGAPVEEEEHVERKAEADEDRDGAGAGEDDELERLRARRRKQMQDRQKKLMEYKELGHGSYEEIVEEDFLKTVTSSSRCIVHFYHRQFERCKIMDMHLRKVAPRFMGTKVVTLNAEKAPFFVQKLGIKTLPTVVLFVNGIVVYKQVGFEALADNDEFKTTRLCRIMKEFDGLEEDFESDDEALQ